jgi:KaiC/GvpD/RAD55 family RecA-like ATPase
MDKRVKTGVDTLDLMLNGGLYSGASCVVKGAPGTGKTTLALQFLDEGLRNGEAGLYITFEEFSGSLYRDAESIGIDLKHYEELGLLKMFFTTPEVFLTMMRKPGGEFDETIVKYGIKRAVVDAFNHIESMADEEPKRMRSLAYSIVNGFRRHHVTSMLLQEDRLFLGDVGGLEFGIPYIVETIIQLKYVELESRVRKALVVLKHRASKHSNEIVEYTISDFGYKIGKQYSADHVISGSAVRRRSIESLIECISDAGSSADLTVRLIEDTLTKMGDSMPNEHYETKDEFVEAIKNGRAGVSKLEANPVSCTDGIHATSVCPFRTTILDLLDRNHEAFMNLAESYKNKYSDLAIVHPFCVCHQNVRKIVLEKTYVKGNPVQSETIACKSKAMGGIEYDREVMAHLKISKKDVDEFLQNNACLFTMHIGDESL